MDKSGNITETIPGIVGASASDRIEQAVLKLVPILENSQLSEDQAVWFVDNLCALWPHMFQDAGQGLYTVVNANNTVSFGGEIAKRYGGALATAGGGARSGTT